MIFYKNFINLNQEKKAIIKGIFKRISELLILLVVCLFYKCPFRLFLHIECPGCGMTRAIISAVKLDFKAAFQYHCLFPLVIMAGGYYVFRDWIRKRWNIGSKQEQAALVIIGTLFVIRWGIHMFL